MRSLERSAAIAVLVAACLAGAAQAQNAGPADQTVERLKGLTLEELTNLTVTSVSKRPEPLSAAPASIYVITADDIRRSGATSLPEVLRLAPNLEVARINAYSYAITARGMNSAEASNKLLVLLNGRSIYEPLSSGVLWQQVDVVLSNIDRIEVVSGPGGTLWGANAVNGVINVITKGASKTQGFSAEASGGEQERNLSLTYGAPLGSGTYRFSVQAFRRDGLDKAPGDPSQDGFSGVQTSFRMGRGDATAGDTFVFNTYDNQIEHDGGNFWGGSVLGRVRRRLAGGSTVDVEAYIARDDRSGPGVHERRDTYDIQAQQALSAGAHQLVWGGEARVWREYFLSTGAFHFAKPAADIGLGAVFVQDEVALRPTLRLTAGLKLEDNSYSGLDWLPNVRLAWTPTEDALVWAAVSRAVRTPNRTERELQARRFLAAAPSFESEILWAFEVGYRAQLTARAAVSATAYYDAYDDLRIESLTNGRLPLALRNGAAGEIHGVEAWGTFDVTDWWRLKAGASALRKDIHLKPGAVDLSRLQAAGTDPAYQAQIRSQMQLGPAVDLDLALRRVGRVTGGVVSPQGGKPVAAYTEADARLGWRIRDGLELSLTGANLLNGHHLEIDDQSTAPLRTVPRSIYLGLRWGF